MGALPAPLATPYLTTHLSGMDNQATSGHDRLLSDESDPAETQVFAPAQAHIGSGCCQALIPPSMMSMWP